MGGAELGDTIGKLVGKLDILKKLVMPAIADLAVMSKGRMDSLLKSIKVSSKKCMYSILPIVLENHTKDIVCFDNIEYFISKCIAEPSIRFVTITELVQLIENREIEVIMKNV